MGLVFCGEFFYNTRMKTSIAESRAAHLCEIGLAHYQAWEIEEAIDALQNAITLDAMQPDYHLHLAQAHARIGDYESMRQCLGNFMFLETDQALSERFEAMFGSGLDLVEQKITEVMPSHQAPLLVVGVALQMWMDFQVAIGRRPLTDTNTVPVALMWAAALDYTVRKVNIHDASLEEIALWYVVNPHRVVANHRVLVDTLDVMPCDYRYFRGPQNPLDKLVEAAIILETLEERFSRIE